MTGNGYFMKKLFLIIIFISFVLQGCMTVNRQMLGKVDVEPPTQKAAAIVEVKAGDFVQTLNGGKPDKDALPGPVALRGIARTILTSWKRSNIIAGYYFEGSTRSIPDYTIIISGSSNKESSTLRNVLCGLTLMLIPASTTMTYDLNIELINNHSRKHYHVKAGNSVTEYRQLFLLPAVLFYSQGGQEMLQDIADYTYDEFKKQGTFNLYL